MTILNFYRIAFVTAFAAALFGIPAAFVAGMSVGFSTTDMFRAWAEIYEAYTRLVLMQKKGAVCAAPLRPVSEQLAYLGALWNSDSSSAIIAVFAVMVPAIAHTIMASMSAFSCAKSAFVAKLSDAAFADSRAGIVLVRDGIVRGV